MRKIFALVLVLMGLLIAWLAYSTMSRTSDTVSVLLQCQIPEALTSQSDVSLSLSLDPSIDAVKNVAAMTSQLSAEFPTTLTDPDVVNRAAAQYQYATCQTISATECGDRDAASCTEWKVHMQNEAFERILKLQEEQARQASERQAAMEAKLAESRDRAVTLCVSAKEAEFVNAQALQSRAVTGGARASGPGIGGGRNKSNERVCVSVGPDQEIVEASYSQISCHGGRCANGPVEYGRDRQTACVATSAWSESKSFGGGGSGQIRLTAKYKNKLTEQISAGFRAACENTTAAEQ